MSESNSANPANSNTPTSCVPIVRQVLDVCKWERAEPNYKYRNFNRMGSVIQCTLKGACRHVCGGRGYNLSRGSVVWLDDMEEHACEVVEAPWVFISVQFIAPSLTPHQFDQSMWQRGESIVAQFVAAHEAWHDANLPPLARSLRIQAAVVSILGDIVDATSEKPHYIEEDTKQWWDLEDLVRQRITEPISLATLEHWTGLNRTKLSKLSNLATNMSCMQRIKAIRLNYAASLLIASDDLVQDIAVSVGYSRVHEFSRDFHRKFGLSPRDYRKNNQLH